MTEADARDALLVRAFESPFVAPWTAADASAATEAARRALGGDAPEEAFVAERARLAANRIAIRLPGLHAVRNAPAGRRRLLGAVLCAAAFVGGVALDAMGPSGRINILAPPLAGLLAWNLAVYLALVVAALRVERHAGAAPRIPAAGASAAMNWPARIARAAASRHPFPSMPAAAAAALARFAAEWSNADAPLLRTRGAAMLHFAAAAFAVGALGSMYLRGLAFEFRAGWESTFLSAAGVRALLGIVLGPASALTGLALPDAAALEALRFPAAVGENAARWIHLEAVTVAMVVLLPRTALAFAAVRRATRLATRFPLPLEGAYFARLLREQRGDALEIRVWPCGMRLQEGASARLREALEAIVDARVVVDLADPIDLGDDDAAGRLPEPVPGEIRAAIFPLAATPERETHGRLAEALVAAAAPAALHVVIDESGFRARLGHAVAESRLPSRRDAWRRLFEAVGITPVFVDLSPVPDRPTA